MTPGTGWSPGSAHRRAATGRTSSCGHRVATWRRGGVAAGASRPPVGWAPAVCVSPPHLNVLKKKAVPMTRNPTEPWKAKKTVREGDHGRAGRQQGMRQPSSGRGDRAPPWCCTQSLLFLLLAAGSPTATHARSSSPGCNQPARTAAQQQSGPALPASQLMLWRSARRVGTRPRHQLPVSSRHASVDATVKRIPPSMKPNSWHHFRVWNASSTCVPTSSVVAPRVNACARRAAEEGGGARRACAWRGAAAAPGTRAARRRALGAETRAARGGGPSCGSP